VHIVSSAPTRIDLAGGTIDIWPLYLFHERAQTLNAAISLRARCTLAPEPARRIVIASADTGTTVQVNHWSELRDNHDLKLLGLLLHAFRAEGVRLETSSASPVGAGIAGSSALNIAVCGALAAWTGRQLEPEALMQIAQNVEAQAIDVPTGVQDYRPAYFGGISAVELRPDGVRRIGLTVDRAELRSRLVLAYTGASRNSGINNWEMFKAHIEGNRDVQARFGRIRDVAVAMRAALEAGNWAEVGAQIREEWENRKGLAPGVTTPAIDGLMREAAEAGALATKICGAGGGGCMIAFCEPSSRASVAAALAAHGARVLDYEIEAQGLSVEQRETAPI
jgi:D-glycero-alpha-D-manno-heptose-7-phosphate kinase